MKIRAAVLEEFGQPLVVQEVDLAEPQAGEVLVRLVACGVCHTDLYTASGADPSGYAPSVLGHEGAGVVERVGEGVTLVAARRPRRHALLARVRRVRPLPERPRRTSASRSASSRTSGYLPDGTTRLSRDGERAPPLHGHVDLRRVHGDAGDRAREGRAPRRRSRAARRSRAGSRPGSAPRSTPRGSSPGRRASSSAAGWSGSAPSSAAGSRAPSGSSPSTSPRSGSRWRGTTARRTRGSAAEDTVEWIREETGRVRRRLHVRGDRATCSVMRQAVEAARRRGVSRPWAASRARARRSTSSRAS